MGTEKILVTGALGQLGTELVPALREIYGEANVIAADLLPSDRVKLENYLQLDCTDRTAVSKTLKEGGYNQVYHLAAILSAKGEQNPALAWNVNINGFMTILDAAVNSSKTKKIFFPSTIAVFGDTTPKDNTPQYTPTEANTVYGISKFVGERLTDYYTNHFGLDIRSIRYPGIISSAAMPGGGTTDYAVHIFHEAVKTGKYTSFLKAGTVLPMMYMPDAMRATIDLMESPAEKIKYRGGYNIAGFSFGPEELAAEIKKHIPEFEMDYTDDPRQAIADSWPRSIDDSLAKEHWGWKPTYSFEMMVSEMLEAIKNKYLQTA